MKNRVSALFVAFVMMLSLLSVGAIAWEKDEGIDVYWNGEKAGTVTYAEMDEHAQKYDAETYSNNKDIYTGKVYTFSKLLKTAGVSDAYGEAPDDTTVVLTDASDKPKPAEFTKAELEETRNYYDKSGTLVAAVKPGFMHIDGEDYFRFVFGQKTPDDETSSRWTKLSGTGNAKLEITTPTTPEPEPADDETEKDGLEVIWNDKSVGTVPYDTMVDGISQASKKYNYSTINSAGTYSSFSTSVYRIEDLMNAIQKKADWDAASNDTTVVFKDSGYETALTKATLTEERYYFDDDGIQADSTKAGFKITESDKGNYMQLVFGQKTKDEVTNGKFFKFKEPAKVYINTPDFEVVAPDGTSKGFFYNDLDVLWQKEGSKKYTYTSSNTYPTFTPEEYWGPTLKTVLAEAGIDLDALSDDDVIRFDATDGRGNTMTVKEIKRTRYAFPNGASDPDNYYKGTTEAQLKDKSEVPFILSIKNGKTNIRNIFGQVDPQEQQMSYFIKYINKITVTKDAAKEYTGLKPTIANGSTVKKGDKLNFDLELPTGIYDGAIHYTVSTDGTEPADPTYADTMYNWSQNRTDDQDYLDPEKAKLYNIYEFTDAPKTIIKVKAYVSGYKEPKAMTLTYTQEAAPAPVEKLNGLAKGTDGKWAMYKDDVVDTTYTGLAKSTYNDQWYYVEDGYLDWNHTGFGKNITTGRWYRVKDGRVDWSANSIYKNNDNGVWYKTKDGRVTFDETGVFQNENGWWRVKDSRVDFKADGIYQNKNGWWKTSGGKVTFNENGVFKNYDNNTWWKVSGSKVDFSYNGLASNANGTWKIKNGKVDFGFSGTYQGKTIKNGKVV